MPGKTKPTTGHVWRQSYQDLERSRPTPPDQYCGVCQAIHPVGVQLCDPDPKIDPTQAPLGYVGPAYHDYIPRYSELRRIMRSDPYSRGW
jgi:hypothetical protein